MLRPETIMKILSEPKEKRDKMLEKLSPENSVYLNKLLIDFLIGTDSGRTFSEIENINE